MQKVTIERWTPESVWEGWKANSQEIFKASEPSVSDVNLAKPIADFIAAEANSRIAALSILPVYTVSQPGDIKEVWKLDPDVLLGLMDTEIDICDEAKTASWPLSSIKFEMEKHAIALPLARQVEDNAEGLSPRKICARACVAKLGLSVDNGFSTFLKSDTNVSGHKKTAANWKTAASGIKGQISTAKGAVHDEVGQPMGWSLILGPTAYYSLSDWLNVNGAALGREQARNQLDVDRAHHFGTVIHREPPSASDSSKVRLYDDEAVLAAASESEGDFRSWFACAFIDAHNNFRINNWVSDSRSAWIAEVRLHIKVVSLIPKAAARFVGVNS